MLWSHAAALGLHPYCYVFVWKRIKASTLIRIRLDSTLPQSFRAVWKCCCPQFRLKTLRQHGILDWEKPGCSENMMLTLNLLLIGSCCSWTSPIHQATVALATSVKRNMDNNNIIHNQLQELLTLLSLQLNSAFYCLHALETSCYSSNLQLTTKFFLFTLTRAVYVSGHMISVFRRISPTDTKCLCGQWIEFVEF